MIRFDGVCKQYPPGASGSGAKVLQDLSLEIEAGSLVAMLGPSGSGKTTALKLVNRLLEPTSGDIFVANENVREVGPVLLRRRIGYVFQRFGLFPHLSVSENVSIVPKLLGWREQEIRARTKELLDMVELPVGRFGSRYPAELSGGQQQRVGVARALAARPRILLMDEPFGALDPATRDRLQPQLLALHRELGLTTLLVTHDVPEALLLADRVVVLGGGRVVADGTPRELVSQPGHPDVADLFQMPLRHAQQLSALRTQKP